MGQRPRRIEAKVDGDLAFVAIWAIAQAIEGLEPYAKRPAGRD